MRACVFEREREREREKEGERKSGTIDARAGVRVCVYLSEQL